MNMQLTTMLTHFFTCFFYISHFLLIPHFPPSPSHHFFTVLGKGNHLYQLLWQLVLFKMTYGLNLCTKEWYQFSPGLIILCLSPLCLENTKAHVQTKYTGPACIQSSRENGISASQYSIRYTNPGSTGSLFSAANIQKSRERQADTDW